MVLPLKDYCLILRLTKSNWEVKKAFLHRNESKNACEQSACDRELQIFANCFKCSPSHRLNHAIVHQPWRFKGAQAASDHGWDINGPTDTVLLTKYRKMRIGRFAVKKQASTCPQQPKRTPSPTKPAVSRKALQLKTCIGEKKEKATVKALEPKIAKAFKICIGGLSTNRKSTEISLKVKTIGLPEGSTKKVPETSFNSKSFGLPEDSSSEICKPSVAVFPGKGKQLKLKPLESVKEMRLQASSSLDSIQIRESTDKSEGKGIVFGSPSSTRKVHETSLKSKSFGLSEESLSEICKPSVAVFHGKGKELKSKSLESVKGMRLQASSSHDSIQIAESANKLADKSEGKEKITFGCSSSTGKVPETSLKSKSFCLPEGSSDNEMKFQVSSSNNLIKKQEPTEKSDGECSSDDECCLLDEDCKTDNGTYFSKNAFIESEKEKDFLRKEVSELKKQLMELKIEKSQLLTKLADALEKVENPA